MVKVVGMTNRVGGVCVPWTWDSNIRAAAIPISRSG